LRGGGRPTHEFSHVAVFFPDQQRALFRRFDRGAEFESDEAAWAEMTRFCGNLLGGVSRSLKQNAEWRVELLDEARKPVFRIRLVSESLGEAIRRSS
jgi:hypothetical protein